MNNYKQEFIEVLEEINDDISKELLSAENDELLEVGISSRKGFVSFNYEGTETRTRIRLGRLVNRILPDNGYSAREIELFVNKYKSIVEFKLANFTVEKGEKILDAYTGNNYNEYSGSLGGSCMTDAGDETLKLYTDNEKKVRILVLNDGNGKIYGRALIWRNVFFRPGSNIEERAESESYKITVMDRVYTTKDYYEDMFKQYCAEKGWYYRTGGQMEFMKPDGETITGRTKINLSNWENLQRLPSLDTMYSMSKKGTLSNKRWNRDNCHEVGYW